MKTILKKSLALAVCVALCLTAFIGCLTVSASGTATAVISTANVANGTTSTNLTVTISGSPNIVGARFDIVADATKATLGTPTVTSGASVEVSTPATNTTRFVVVADNVSTGLASIVVTLPYTNVTTTAGTYDVEFGSLLEVAEVGETLMTVTPTDGAIVVEAPHVHDFSGAWQSNANYHWKVCPADDTVGEQAAHTFGGWTTTVQPGCTTTGTKTRTCSVCGYVESDTVAATGHTPAAAVQENVVAATCGAAGSYDSVVYCSVCNAEISRTTGNVIPATGEHSWNAGVVTTAPGCTTEGVLTKTCTVCGATDTEAISATGHTAGAAANEDVVAPTCTAAGSHNSVVRCTVCNAILSTTPVVDAATGHTPAAAVQENVVAATCGAAGSYDSVVYCSVCNAEISRETVNVPATGEHTAAAAVQENVVAATCGAAGSYDSVVYCSVCNAEISRTTGNVIPATGAHTYGEYTSDAEGHSRTCSVCGYVDAGEHDGDPCSVCGYTAPVVEPEVITSLALGRTILARDKMGVRFMTVKAQLTSYADYYLEIESQHFRTVAAQNYKLVEDVDLYKFVADGDTAPEGYNAQSAVDTNYVYFDYTGITAYEMTLPISATIYCLNDNGDVVAKSQTWTFTLADRIRTSALTNSASDAAFVDMVNYGTAVQNYFAAQYPTSDLGLHTVLPNAGFDAYQKYATSGIDADDAVSINSGVSETAANGAMVGKGLQVQATNQLYFMVLAGSNNVEDLSLKITYVNSYSADKSAIAPVSGMTRNGSIYYYYFDADKNVALYDTAVPVVAELYSGETLLYTRTYSVESFVAETMASGNAQLRAVGDTLMKFTYSLRAKLGLS